MSKQFIYEGDTVRLKQDIANSPDMVVESIDKISPEPGAPKRLAGLRCFWFTTEMAIQKNRFDFKDLLLIKRATDYDR